ncbi:DUF6415 family natural product biosynthesis protein [Streptomyces lydicus]|uniref:DUF6415 family natural product biosynthesis protein n=1 Tax=Streptomyces lydicus TaxID=47763 RepID=UPI002E36FFBC|nr:DUF6415 family natural product biosynthesis protein [Streptomyces lydicus]
MNDHDISSDVERETVDRNLIQQTIERAQGLRRTAADADELVRTVEALRGHIALLMPDAEEATNRLWRGSIEWSRRTGRLSGVRFQAGQVPGPGRLSVHVQLGQLARDCQWLLDDYKERRK